MGNTVIHHRPETGIQQHFNSPFECRVLFFDDFYGFSPEFFYHFYILQNIVLIGILSIALLRYTEGLIHTIFFRQFSCRRPTASPYFLSEAIWLTSLKANKKTPLQNICKDE
jgi:hypothetical protein